MNARAIATLGIGFTPMAAATLGFIGASSPVGPSAPIINVNVGGGGSWTSDRYYYPEPDIRKGLVVKAHSWDQAKSHSFVSAEVICRGIRAHGVSKLVAVTRGRVERLSTGRFAGLSRATGKTTLANSIMAQTSSFSGARAKIVPIRLGTANDRFGSYGTVLGRAEIAGRLKSSVSSCSNSAQAESVTIFTDEQIEMLTIIANQTFFED